MKKRLRPNVGKGRELQELLRRELGIPENTRWFTVRFAVDELIVTCEYFPEHEVPGVGVFDSSVFREIDATDTESLAREVALGAELTE